MEYLVHLEVLENKVDRVEKVGLLDIDYLPNVLHQDSSDGLFSFSGQPGETFGFPGSPGQKGQPGDPGSPGRI